jgi:hypothetical protein
MGVIMGVIMYRIVCGLRYLALCLGSGRGIDDRGIGELLIGSGHGECLRILSHSCSVFGA